MKNEMLGILKAKKVKEKDDYHLVLTRFMNTIVSKFRKYDVDKEFNTFSRGERTTIRLIANERLMTRDEYVKTFKRIENKAKSVFGEDVYVRPEGFSPDYIKE